jgi:hypothetical protein
MTALRPCRERASSVRLDYHADAVIDGVRLPEGAERAPDGAYRLGRETLAAAAHRALTPTEKR